MAKAAGPFFFRRAPAGVSGWTTAFWTERLQDLDVIVTLTGRTNSLDPLRGIFDWLQAHGFRLDGEHAIIAGVPVQFLVAWNSLVTDAVAQASVVPYDPQNPDVDEDLPAALRSKYASNETQ